MLRFWFGALCAVFSADPFAPQGAGATENGPVAIEFNSKNNITIDFPLQIDNEEPSKGLQNPRDPLVDLELEVPPLGGANRDSTERAQYDFFEILGREDPSCLEERLRYRPQEDGPSEVLGLEFEIDGRSPENEKKKGSDLVGK